MSSKLVMYFKNFILRKEYNFIFKVGYSVMKKKIYIYILYIIIYLINQSFSQFGHQNQKKGTKNIKCFIEIYFLFFL